MDQLRGDDNVVADASNSPKKIVGFNTIVALVTIAVLAGITAAAIHMAGHGRQRNRSSGLERLDGSLFFSALSLYPLHIGTHIGYNAYGLFSKVRCTVWFAPQ